MNIITEVNKNFVIRYKYDDDRKTSIKGAGKYSHFLEKAKNPEKMALSHFEKALNSELNKINIRLRGGLSITFHRK